MKPDNITKKQTVFTFFDLVFITIALIIGNTIHQLDIRSVFKIFIVIVICVLIYFFDKSEFRQKWKITKAGKINKYVFFGYAFIVYIVIQFL